VPFDAPLCFARVDLVATASGPAVIEVELIEPFLFLEHHDAAAARLARAIARRANR
jgi:cob(I)alamin adenosyltransferase